MFSDIGCSFIKFGNWIVVSLYFKFFTFGCIFPHAVVFSYLDYKQYIDMTSPVLTEPLACLEMMAQRC